MKNYFGNKKQSKAAPVKKVTQNTIVKE